MAKILILNIDRDDDFGRKAHIQSPIIGLSNNLEAAMALGRVDPEDSDVNAIFSAIHAYESMKKEGKDVEIVTICGDISVGFKSDARLTEQLQQVISQLGAEEAILISDGAEDEFILPLVQSRIKITSIQRVTVKQSKQLEDAYYRVIKLLDDDKVKKQFFIPVALILIVWAIFVILNMAATGFGAILFTLGIYLLIRTFNSEKKVASLLRELHSGLVAGRPFFYSYILALVIIAVSIFYAMSNTVFSAEVPLVLSIITFVRHITWGIVAAGLLAAFGRVADTYVRDKKILWQYWTIPFSLFTFGFIVSAVLESLYNSIVNKFSIVTFFSANFIGYTSAGIIIAFIGAISYHYIKETYLIEHHEKEIDEQTQIASALK
ncbi:MAG: DUF373 family protein [Candidatus Thermoplasmatota archaeon]